MEFRIENFRVRRFDDMNLILEEQRLSKPRKPQSGAPKMKWVFQGYYGNLDVAVNSLCSHYLNRSKAEGLVELQKAISDLRNAISDECSRVSNEDFKVNVIK